MKLGVGRDFSSWLKARLKKYGFIKDFDYFIDSPNRGNQKGGDRRSKEYTLTTDVAKELCMVKNNNLGRKFRKYFIDCERVAMGKLQVAKYSISSLNLSRS